MAKAREYAKLTKYDFVDGDGVKRSMCWAANKADANKLLRARIRAGNKKLVGCKTFKSDRENTPYDVNALSKARAKLKGYISKEIKMHTDDVDYFLNESKRLIADREK